jgi:hypothetical protein
MKQSIMKTAKRLNQTSEALSLTGTEGCDYTLNAGRSVWITVGDVSLYIRRVGNVVLVSAYPKGEDDGDELFSAAAHIKLSSLTV